MIMYGLEELIIKRNFAFILHIVLHTITIPWLAEYILQEYIMAFCMIIYHIRIERQNKKKKKLDSNDEKKTTMNVSKT